MRRLSLLLLPVLLAGCMTRLSSIQDPPPEPGRLPLAGNCSVHVDHFATEGLAKLVADSSLIVEGTVAGSPGTRNLARNPQNPQLPDPNQIIEGIDYQISVERYIKGDGPKSLTFSLARSTKMADQEKACLHEDYHNLKVGDRFVLFVKPHPFDAGLVIGAGYPWLYYVKEHQVGPEFGPGGPTEREAFLQQVTEALK